MKPTARTWLEIPLALVWLAVMTAILYRALRDGEVSSKPRWGGETTYYSQEADPIRYWLTIVLYFALLAFSVFIVKCALIDCGLIPPR